MRPKGSALHSMRATTFTFSLSPADEVQAKKGYGTLRYGGQVTMDLQSTFWAELFAMRRDKHGIQWMISYGPWDSQ